MNEELRNSCAFPENIKPCGNCSLCKLRAAEKERDEAREAANEYIRKTDPILDTLEALSNRASAAEEVLKAHQKEWLEEAARLIQEKEAAYHERDTAKLNQQTFQDQIYNLLVQGYGPGGGFYTEEQRLGAAVSLLQVGWGKK